MKEKTERVQFQGRTYPVKGFMELTGSDWQRIVLTLERGIEFPEQTLNALRGCLHVWVPSAKNDMRNFDDTDILNFVAAVWQHVKLDDGPALMKRYADAAEMMCDIIRERYSVQEEDDIPAEEEGVLLDVHYGAE